MNNLTTKNFFTTKRLYEEIIKKTFAKEGVNPDIQQYKYLQIINKIICHKIFIKDKNVGCPMNVDALTALFGGNDKKSSAILKDLKDWGFIVISQEYKYKQSSRRYTIAEQYANDGILIMPVDITDAGFVKKLIDYDKIEIDKTVKQLGTNIKNITINNNGISYLSNKYNINLSIPIIERSLVEETAFKVIKTTINGNKEPEFWLGGVEVEVMDLALISIYLGDYNTSRPDPKSRVYNNLTNLKRELRQYVSFNDKPLMMTDISNCQVLLSVSEVIKEYVIKSGLGYKVLTDDIKLYKSLAESGKFYEYLISRSGYTGDRNKFKKDFFSQVFFSKPVKYSMPIKDAFMEAFPIVYRIINQLKANDYRDFAISMQRMEASIMIDTVAKKMIKAGKRILTLHDAIVCDNEADLELAEKLIFDAMVKHRIVPKFKRESSDMAVFKKDEISAEVISTVVMEESEKLIQHSFGEVLIRNYEGFRAATATLTGDDMQTLVNRFSVSAMGYSSVTINNVIYSFIVKYEDVEGEDDEMKVIVFKEKLIRKLVA